MVKEQIQDKTSKRPRCEDGNLLSPTELPQVYLLTASHCEGGTPPRAYSIEWLKKQNARKAYNNNNDLDDGFQPLAHDVSVFDVLKTYGRISHTDAGVTTCHMSDGNERGFNLLFGLCCSRYDGAPDIAPPYIVVANYYMIDAN